MIYKVFSWEFFCAIAEAMNDQKFKSCHYSLEEDKVLFLNEQVSIFGVISSHLDLIDTCTVIFERNITETTEKTTI